MNIAFEPKQPVTQTEEKIIVNGQCIGWCRDDAALMKGWAFHVGITLGDGLSGTLIQGFGATREAAIEDALTKGRIKAEFDIRAMDKLIEEIAWGKL